MAFGHATPSPSSLSSFASFSQQLGIYDGVHNFCASNKTLSQRYVAYLLILMLTFNSIITSICMGFESFPNYRQSSNDVPKLKEKSSSSSPSSIQVEGEENGSWLVDLNNLNTKVNESLLIRNHTELDLMNELKTSNVNRLLVRQLTNLIMNNEPEKFAQNIEGNLVNESGSDYVTDETIDSDMMRGGNGSYKTSNNGIIEPSLLITENGATEGEIYTDTQDIEQHRQQQQHQQRLASGTNINSDEQSVTCSPDYEDQTIAEASSNLTAEQQQQLLSGADSSGLLTPNITNLAENQVQVTRGSSGSGQCFPAGVKMITKVIAPILFSIIIVVGLLGNIIVMIVILEDRKTERELTPTNLLILDLSLADLSFIIFCIPFTAWDYSVGGHWVFGSLWCKFNQYLIVVCALSSIYTLVLMSIDRFMAIVYPIECISYRTSKNTLYAIYIKWILILIMASPTIPMHGLIDSHLGPDQYTCRFLADQFNPLHFQITFFITSYLFPLILIFCLYLSLLNKLWYGSKPHGHKESLKMLESKKRVTWLVAAIVVVFALCWCPIQVMLILMRLNPYRVTATYVAIQVFSHTLGYMNSCVNPIVYAFASETFNNSFKRSSLGRLCYMCFCLKNSHHEDHDRPANFNNIHTNTSLLNDHTTSSHHNQTLNHHCVSLHKSTEKNGALGNDNNNISTTTLLMTPHNSNREQVSKIVTLPLEPRDRDVHLLAVAVDNLSQFNNNKDDIKAQDKVLVAREPASSGLQTRMPTKQQLVARVVQSGNQISHRCYQQEFIAP